MTWLQAGPRLVLASGSASRRALLEAAGLVFAVRPAAIDEAAVKQVAQAEGRSAAQAAMRLAELKAAAIAAEEPDAVVIGADQILVCDGVWHDKPPTLEAAQAQLRTLRGRTHELATAVVCYAGRTCVWRHADAPRLAMRPFSDGFLADYLAAEGPMATTTVGAYRLEGLGAHLFEAIEGSHSSILGLPLLPLLGFLRQRGCITA